MQLNRVAPYPYVDWIESYGEFNITWIEIDDMVYSICWNVIQNKLCRFAVRINKTDTFTCKNTDTIIFLN